MTEYTVVEETVKLKVKNSGITYIGELLAEFRAAGWDYVGMIQSQDAMYIELIRHYPDGKEAHS